MRTWKWILVSGCGLATAGPMATALAANQNGGSAGNAISAAEQEAQQSGRAADDASLATDVKAKLAEQLPSASGLNVEATNGVVTLTGSVPTRNDRQQAASLARGANGVKGVRDQLEIKSSGI
ncbi:MAG TPA: BON domain-containing protein [Polyangia bacterium]|nr:BON domain-containing protein [Polyangia bacterium]